MVDRTRQRQHKLTSAQTVINFVREHFQEKVSPTWVSNTLSSLGFSSQKVRQAWETKPLHQKLPEIKKFIAEVRSLIEDGVELSRIVAVDEVGFWSSGVVLRSYAIRGG
jgi:hypothetical protein